MYTVSVVIPCYQDEQVLKRLLIQLCALKNPPLEVIVVDGAHQENCRELCGTYGASWLPAVPCRGRQLQVGAAKARGAVLWFLHADACLPADPLSALRLALVQGALGGYFRFSFNLTGNWSARLLEKAIAWRCRMGVPYGDQGIFVRRESYFLAGGHGPWPLFEEVPLVHNLRKLGRFRSLPEPLLIDPRRWQRDGWWRRTWQNRKLALGYMCGVSPDKLARRYLSAKK
ncbi:MAG: TIGR04283 family arsenosugar biosynthesis glycosyltransferase [Nitrosomonas sp.]|nr:TIGR04283 family arsenosugar biosynthesis glycosyltransferase [Nitrosomonas sp.]